MAQLCEQVEDSDPIIIYLINSEQRSRVQCGSADV